MITVFTVALLATLVAGILQLAAEQSQLMQNQVYAAQATQIAEAGLNDAMAQLRTDREWKAGFSAKQFAGGTYTVAVNNENIPTVILVASGTSPQGYAARITAQATVGDTAPFAVRIDTLKVNR